VLAGQVFDCARELQSDWPDEIGRQFAHVVSVALGKWLAPQLKHLGTVAGLSQPRPGTVRAVTSGSLVARDSSGAALVSGVSGGLAGGPVGEEVQGFEGWAVGFGGVGDDYQPVAGQFHGFAGELEVADE